MASLAVTGAGTLGSNILGSSGGLAVGEAASTKLLILIGVKVELLLVI